MGERRRVAILGAGPAGLTAAWHLSDPAHRGSVEVTVYQMGWRAGGLCSTGRVGPQQWVNQNGTHYMFGCYRQSLALMAGAFDELGRHGDARFGTFDEQLVPRNLVVLKQLFRCGWTDWAVTLPVLPDDERHAWSTHRGLGLLLRASLERLLQPDLAGHMRRAASASKPDPARSFWKSLLDGAEALIADPFERLARDAIGQAERFVLDGITPVERGAMVDVASFVRGLARDTLGPLSGASVDLLRALILTELGLSIFIGALEDHAYTPEGLAAMDVYDFREWLRKHGCRDFAVDSAATQVWYAAIAAFAGGSPDAPTAAAGASLVCMLDLLFNYRGSVAYQLTNEIGDSFVGPIVAALIHRGVRFAFFHRVWDVVPGDDGRIASVVLERQAEVRGGPHAYDPFMAGVIEGRAVWPDDPRWDQLSEVHGPRNPGMWQQLFEPPPEALGACPIPSPFVVAQSQQPVPLPSMENAWYPRSGPEVVLRAGVDFDVVIAALRHTMYPLSAPSLLKASSKWRTAVERVGATETQSLRVWFNCDLPGIGWTLGPPITSSYVLPYATWEDPSPVLASENWNGRCQTIAHVFGPLPHAMLIGGEPNPVTGLSSLAAQYQRALFDAGNWARYAVGTLWPGAACDLQPNCLTAKHVAAIQVRPNSGPDQLYTAIIPGTARYRLRNAETDYPNLVVAGDWTYTRLLTGSLEGAVDSGRSAASAALNALSS